MSVRAPIQLQSHELIEKLTALMEYARSVKNGIACVVDEVPIELEEAVRQIGSPPQIRVMLTKRSQIPDSLYQFCHHVMLPKHALPGKIGGFFICKEHAIFLHQGKWHYAFNDEDVLRELCEVGDRVIRLTGMLE